MVRNNADWNKEREYLAGLVSQLRRSVTDLLDGANGYICENGSGKRYWKHGVVEDAKLVLDRAVPAWLK